MRRYLQPHDLSALRQSVEAVIENIHLPPIVFKEKIVCSAVHFLHSHNTCVRALTQRLSKAASDLTLSKALLAYREVYGAEELTALTPALKAYIRSYTEFALKEGQWRQEETDNLDFAAGMVASVAAENLTIAGRMPTFNESSQYGRNKITPLLESVRDIVDSTLVQGDRRFAKQQVYSL